MLRETKRSVLGCMLLMAACGRGHDRPAAEDAGAVPEEPTQPGEPNQPEPPAQPPTTPGKADDPRVAFPLELSANQRYLVDQRGRPFLINQASSWGLIQSLSTKDATDYLDGLAARGFNTILVSVISNDQRMPGDPPAWQGIEPFTTRWDFSTPNSKYFAHADEILKLARERGMLVTLVPCYLGYATDPTQGWADELLSDHNDIESSRSYGRFLGDRYEQFDNIVWVAGGDNSPDPGSELEQHLKAIVDGIRERDPRHLWTAHWSSGTTGVMSSENPTFASIMDLNGFYAFNYDLTYERVLDYYAKEPVKPLFHLDMSYETEPGGTPDNIRRKAYSAILSGAMGSSFNAGPDWYLFRNWKRMDSQGTRETQHWYRLFASRPWHELVPDRDHRALVRGHGELGSTNYLSAAITPQGDLLIAYLPRGGEVTVDMGVIQGERARAFWFDPRTVSRAPRAARTRRAKNRFSRRRDPAGCWSWKTTHAPGQRRASRRRLRSVPEWAHDDEYFASDGIHANDVGSNVIADELWKIMKANCIAQPVGSECCTP